MKTLKALKFNQKSLFNYAFTMTEAILVMTILGVIATVMISTIKPQEYKEKALRISAKKVLNSIDHATSMILINDSLDGSMYNIVATSGTKFNIAAMANKAGADNLGGLYKKYLVSTRKTCADANCQCYTMTPSASRSAINAF